MILLNLEICGYNEDETMAMGIEGLVIDYGDDVFYDPDFLNMIDDHYTYLMEDSGTGSVELGNLSSYVNEGDLVAVLGELNVAPKYAYAVARLNKLTSVTDLKDSVTSLIIPNLSIIESLALVFQTKEKI